jgi:hypothetical protein
VIHPASLRGELLARSHFFHAPDAPLELAVAAAPGAVDLDGRKAAGFEHDAVDHLRRSQLAVPVVHPADQGGRAPARNGEPPVLPAPVTDVVDQRRHL